MAAASTALVPLEELGHHVAWPGFLRLLFVKAGQSVADALTFIPSILHDMQELRIILLAHCCPVLRQFADSGGIPFGGNVVLGNQPLFF